MSNKDSSLPSRTEKIYVLFGSQTGNSEQAAEDFCAAAPQKLSPTVLRQAYGAQQDITVETVCLPLDDFLEYRRANWTRLTVIFTSSYGVGQAPLGCSRFRELCDAWKIDQNNNKVLQGLCYALCGLGDSKYTTFFQNPTVIDQALQNIGATRIGPLGKCDASGSGDNEQPLVISRWIEGIWDHVAQCIVQEPLSPKRLQAAQEETVALCAKINPDFASALNSGQDKKNYHILSIVLVVLAIVLAFFFNLNNNTATTIST